MTGEVNTLKSRHEFLPPEHLILGNSRAMSEVRAKFERLASTDIPVMIRGEAGTGKEILARFIHKRYPGEETPLHKVTPAGRNGWRRSATFVSLPGRSVRGRPEKNIDGATGCIGTLFFDEVADLNAASQRILCQLLQDGWPAPLASPNCVSPLFRVICSTRRDLEQEMKVGQFNRELFYSIHIVTLYLPPLRARSEDIPPLARYFWQSYQDEFESSTPEPSSAFLAALQEHDWPGNIRELAQVMKRYVLMGSEQTAIEELKRDGHHYPALSASAGCGISLKSLAREEARQLERRVIFNTLRETQWNRRKTARALNISYRSLLYKIKEAGLPPKRTDVHREKPN